MTSPQLKLSIVKQEGDKFINDIALRLNLPITQRKAINRVHIHLQVLLASNLLIYKKNVIKYLMCQGIVNKNYASAIE